MLVSLAILVVAAYALPNALTQREWGWLALIALMCVAAAVGGRKATLSLLRKRDAGTPEQQRKGRYLAYERFRRGLPQMLAIAYEREDMKPHLPYTLTVQTGDSDAGDQNTVEFMLCFHPINVHRHDGGLSVTTEHGASLMYRLTDDGHVTYVLFPATVKNPNKSRDKIILGVVDPAVLLDRGTQHRHLSYLAAYMAHTRLNGQLTWRQRQTIRWLRYTKEYVEDGKHHRARLVVARRKFWHWFFYVGMSGALVALGTWLFSIIKILL